MTSTTQRTRTPPGPPDSDPADPAPRDPAPRDPAPRDPAPRDRGQASAAASPVDADRVFAALADPRRRELLELLGNRPRSASSLAESLPVSRQAVAQHLTVLEDSRLVSRRRAGREVLFSVRPEGLAATADWLTVRAIAWQERMEFLKRQPGTRARQSD